MSTDARQANAGLSKLMLTQHVSERKGQKENLISNWN